MKKGFVFILPLVVIAILATSSIATLSVRQEKAEKQAVGQVLSERMESSVGSDISVEKSNKTDKSNIKIEQKNDTSVNTKIKTETNSKSTINSKVEINQNSISIGDEIDESDLDDLEREIEDEELDESSREAEETKQELKIKTDGLRVQIKSQGGRVEVKVFDKTNKDVEVDSELKDKIAQDAEGFLSKEDLKIASDSAGLVHKGKRVRTHFPLSIDPLTGQLYVTTPAGVKAVATLPANAIENMIRGGVITRLVDLGQNPSTPPSEGSGSATVSADINVADAQVELTEVEGKIVYKINGVKTQKFVGIFPLDLKVLTTVSADNGELLDVKEGFLTRILDILSF